jgi:agmatinase
LALPETVREELRACPVYLSVDLDVLDPAVAPGVGNPEPGGPSFSDLVQSLYSLRDLTVVGVDLVETAPSLDPSGATAVVAAKLLREVILALCRSRTLA